LEPASVVHPYPAPPPRLARIVWVLLGVFVVAGWVGTGLSAMLLVKNPLLLIALAPDGRHIALAVGSVPPLWLFVVGVLRRTIFSITMFGLGYVYGDAALKWVEAQYPRLGAIVRYFERLFVRVGSWCLVPLPFGTICVLAGAARARFAAFMAAILVGHTLWVALNYAIGTLISDFTDRLLGFLKDHLVESTLVCIALMVLYQLVTRRRGAKSAES
jgi:uncharacterized membrane protein YdjX (TVP38/TMEM64 family)